MGYEVEQPPVPVAPLVMVQLIPDGLELTPPLPPAPAPIERTNEFDCGSKLTTTSTLPVTVTWQASPVSPLGAQFELTSLSLAFAAGVSVSVTMAPDLNPWLHFPDTLPLAPMVQLRPPRSDTTVPPAKVPVPLMFTWYLVLTRANSGSLGMLSWQANTMSDAIAARTEAARLDRGAGRRSMEHPGRRTRQCVARRRSPKVGSYCLYAGRLRLLPYCRGRATFPF